MNLLTRKDYEKALNGLRELEKEDNSKKLSIKNVPQLKADTLNELIHEHFDNPPLEFEELKPNMWVWDNKRKAKLLIGYCYSKDDMLTIIFQNPEDYKYIHLDFEENRFYRKEVKDVD